MTNNEKAYLMLLADIEYEKYLRFLNHAKDALARNDKKALGYCLKVASMALKQSAAYRTRRTF